MDHRITRGSTEEPAQGYVRATWERGLPFRQDPGQPANFETSPGYSRAETPNRGHPREYDTPEYDTSTENLRNSRRQVALSQASFLQASGNIYPAQINAVAGLLHQMLDIYGARFNAGMQPRTMAHPQQQQYQLPRTPELVTARVYEPSTQNSQWPGPFPQDTPSPDFARPDSSTDESMEKRTSYVHSQTASIVQPEDLSGASSPALATSTTHSAQAAGSLFPGFIEEANATSLTSTLVSEPERRLMLRPRSQNTTPIRVYTSSDVQRTYEMLRHSLKQLCEDNIVRYVSVQLEVAPEHMLASPGSMLFAENVLENGSDMVGFFSQYSQIVRLHWASEALTDGKFKDVIKRFEDRGYLRELDTWYSGSREYMRFETAAWLALERTERERIREERGRSSGQD